MLSPTLLNTPKRARKSIEFRSADRHLEHRRSLFGRDSDDDAALLSPTSSEIGSPMKSPRGILTNLESNFNQLLLNKSPCGIIEDSPIKGNIPLMKGVGILKEDNGLIPAKSFYGGQWDTLDGKDLFAAARSHISPKVRTRLFIDDVVTTKKRGRTASVDTVKRPTKMPKLQENGISLNIKPKKKISPKNHEKSGATKRKNKKAKENIEVDTSVASKKKKKKYNWEIFSTGNEKRFFRSLNSSVIMTPPSSTKKKLLSRNLDFYSPENSDSELDESADSTEIEKKGTDDLVQEIKNDVLEMIQDDGEEEKIEVGNILDTLDKTLHAEHHNGDASLDLNITASSCTNGSSDMDGLISSEQLLSSPSTPSGSEKRAFYPIFEKLSKQPSTPSLTPNEKKSVSKLGFGADQMLLDAGQNNLREIQCPTCELVYLKGVPEDEDCHNQFHNKMKKQMTYNGLRNERLAGIDGAARILLIRNDDSASSWKKARDYLSVVGEILGTPVDDIYPSQIYIYIQNKEVVGLLAASRLEKAFKMLPFDDVPSNPLLCSEESYVARCGVSVIWVAAQSRHRGVGTALMNALRRNFMIGAFLKLNEIAFSSPTAEGNAFAAKYFKRKDFLVYL